MSLTPSDIRLIIDSLHDSGWDQADVVIGDVHIAVARNGLALGGATTAKSQAAPPNGGGSLDDSGSSDALATPISTESALAGVSTPVETPAAAASESAIEPLEGHVLASPSVGVFWRAPQPGAPPFVEIGQRVEAGETVGIVEVMKLMNPIASDVTGEVIAVHVANAGVVEFGTPLVTIRVED